MQQARLFQIVWALQQGPSTAAALARRFEVSVRTIQRDIDALSGAGVPVYCTRGRGGGIGLLPGFVLDRSYLTGAEQREVLLGLQSLAAAGEADAGSALQKLAGLFQRPEESWLQVDFAQWGAGPEEKRAGARRDFGAQAGGLYLLQLAGRAHRAHRRAGEAGVQGRVLVYTGLLLPARCGAGV